MIISRRADLYDPLGVHRGSVWAEYDPAQQDKGDGLMDFSFVWPSDVAPEPFGDWRFEAGDRVGIIRVEEVDGNPTVSVFYRGD